MPKFYSTKEGALCTRYGTGTYIGASIVVKNGATAIVFDPEEVVSISDEEFAKYSREYLGMLADGSLVERKEKDFKAWNARLEKSEVAAFEEAKAEAEKVEAAAKAEAEKVNTPASTAANTES